MDAEELSGFLATDLFDDDSLSTTTPLKGWEETLLEQEQDGGGQLEIKISLPSMPSLYITAFLFQACQEIYRIGGHVLDKVILQLFAWRHLEIVLNIYEKLIPYSEELGSRVSEKGLLVFYKCSLTCTLWWMCYLVAKMYLWKLLTLRT
eukprot:Gb_20854 [translate_table: standard]